MTFLAISHAGTGAGILVARRALVMEGILAHTRLVAGIAVRCCGSGFHLLMATDALFMAGILNAGHILITRVHVALGTRLGLAVALFVIHVMTVLAAQAKILDVLFVIKQPFFAKSGLKDAVGFMTGAARLLILPFFPGYGMVALNALKAVFILMYLVIKKDILARGLQHDANRQVRGLYRVCAIGHGPGRNTDNCD